MDFEKPMVIQNPYEWSILAISAVLAQSNSSQPTRFWVFGNILRISYILTQYVISPCPTVFRFHILHHSANQATNCYPYVAIPKFGEQVVLKLICTEYPYVAIPKFGEPVALKLICTEYPYAANNTYGESVAP